MNTKANEEFSPSRSREDQTDQFLMNLGDFKTFPVKTT
jgi:hypothetical protein